MALTKRSLSILGAVWLTALIAAFIYRDTLAACALGTLVLTALCFPLAFALYMLGQALAEGALLLLLLAAFKVVTLGLVRTELTSQGTMFPWHGFARDHDDRLVASEACVYIIGVAVYVAAGVSWYFFYP